MNKFTLGHKRKLASIQLIKEIVPIKGADRIEAARVNGWWVVVEKGKFKLRDKVIYFEIDSVLPVKPEFEFLRDSCYIKRDWIEGFRIKTRIFKGQISQGLIINYLDFYKVPKETGDDCTEAFGVKIWDPPLPAELLEKCKGYFPSFFPKTGCERMQNIHDRYKDRKYYQNLAFDMSIKLDGKSCSVFYKDDETGVCGKILQFKDGAEVDYTRVTKKVIEALKKEKINIAIQGELIGTKEGCKEKEFYIFKIFDIDKYVCWSTNQIKSFAKKHKLKVVPFPLVNVFPFRMTLEELLEIANNQKGMRVAKAEGVVFQSRTCNFSFKVVSNKKLLKESKKDKK